MKLILSQPLIIQLICLIGCAFQTYTITIEYLQFKTRSDATFEHPTFIELPAIDIRVPIAPMINKTELCSRYSTQMSGWDIVLAKYDPSRNESGTVKSECSSSDKLPIFYGRFLHDFLTVRDIHELIPDPEEIIHSIEWRYIYEQGFEANKVRKNLKRSNYCRTSKYFNSRSIFIRVSCKNGTDLFRSKFNRLIDDAIYFEMKLKIGHPFSVKFNDHNKLPEIADGSYHTPDSKMFYIKYSKIVTKSLPYPYETLCQNYDKMAELHECVSRNTTNSKFPYLQKDVLSEWNTRPENCHFKYESLSKIEDSCNEKVDSPECDQISYSLITEKERSVGHATEVFPADHPYSLILIPPTDPILSIIAYPLFSFVEYLIFVGSISGLWFGFSIFHQLVKCPKVDICPYSRKAKKSEANVKDGKWSRSLRENFTNNHH